MGKKQNLSRVIVLEDNDAVADRVCDILEGINETQIVKRCASLKEALAIFENEVFDFFLCDLLLPDGSGIDAIRALKRKTNDCPVVVMSALNDRKTVIKAIKAGAVGYILKDDDKLDVINAIEAVLFGESPISIGIARHLVNLVHQSSPSIKEDYDGIPKLTTRELEVLNAIAKGLANKEVAQVFGISAQTVPVHIRNIYKKLQASNRSEAAYEARRLGIIDE